MKDSELTLIKWRRLAAALVVVKNEFLLLLK